MLAHAGVGVALGDVDLKRHPAEQGPRRLIAGLAREQHPAHVRMHDNRVGRLVRRLHAAERAPLNALACVVGGALIGDLGLRQSFLSHHQPLVIHHREHGLQSLVRLADEVAHGVFVVHHAGRCALDAHLVLDGAARERVAFSERAIRVDQILGHQEHADALHALRGIRQAREDEMHDVLGEVLITAADEDLGAAHAIAAVAVRHRPRAQHAEIRACVGFGETHDTRPAAVDELGQIRALHLVAAVGANGHVGAARQPRVERE